MNISTTKLLKKGVVSILKWEELGPPKPTPVYVTLSNYVSELAILSWPSTNQIGDLYKSGTGGPLKCDFEFAAFPKYQAFLNKSLFLRPLPVLSCSRDEISFIRAGQNRGVPYDPIPNRVLGFESSQAFEYHSWWHQDGMDDVERSNIPFYAATKKILPVPRLMICSRFQLYL